MTPQTADPLVNPSDETVLKDSQHTTPQSPAGSANGAATVAQQSQMKYVPAGTGAAYWGPGTVLTFIVTGKDTGGAFFLAEMSVPPGGGPPPHIHHREDESFHMLEGMLTVQVGGNTITASAGDFAYLPRGIVHSFKNTGDGFAKVLVLTTPAGLENYFAEVFDPVTDHSAAPPPPSREMLARAMAISPRYGLVLLPPA
ncbi:MAG: quercetin 2,3-dioxygenase [Terriglobia bacterium]|nr:quercetin 2,3-dioxygenase [Terriglobia bacterium]